MITFRVCGVRKLTSVQILEIRQLRASGKTLASIADRYGVCLQNIHHVVTGKTWKDGMRP